MRRHPRSRSITLRTDPALRAIRVTSPPYVPVRQITDFIRQKSAWIENSFAKAGPIARLEAGNSITFRGQRMTICWQQDWPRRIVQEGGEIHVGGPCESVAKRVAAWLKKEARTRIIADIADYSALAAISPPPLALSNARRRWGSCSQAGKIRINWRLIMAPDSIRRSVVAHEIAHMRHMNHSPAFYAWLDHLYEGDRRAADDWLKQHGAALHAVITQ
ncbi:SprT family zinc-dependent metalloprotease [Sphingorhabdus sp. Alg239-R122]|uniref:M48 family metallopeptidase n=1 Tax=Sphingorhabdus sp. Alg239-R122 TaxID=2305989 RepID=UPI001967D77F|nr:SprT family zinc-dependent metalloprotease [Sphingorhabdus sp. Alg239-R122]